MKNGFTLIELLAVIVVLAIIALIAVPVVLNIINDAKESSLLRSAEFYLDAVEYTIADAFLYHGGLSNGEYPITPEGNICKKALPCDDANTLKVEVSGDKPTGGFITIDAGNINDVDLTLDEKTIVKDVYGKLVYKENTSICKLINDATPKGISAGDKYQCKVKDDMEEGWEDGYYFFVLSTEEDGTTNLIMDRNINSDGTPATKALLESEKKSNGGIYNYVVWVNTEKYYEDVGGVIPDEVLNDDGACQRGGDCSFNDKGPLAAMKFLQDATKNWTNTNEMTIDKYDNDTGTIFNMQEYKVNARLPYFREVSDYDGTNGYLYDYLSLYNNIQTNVIDGFGSYWTLSSRADDSYSAWYVSCGGELWNAGVEGTSAVRPVINVKL